MIFHIHSRKVSENNCWPLIRVKQSKTKQLTTNSGATTPNQIYGISHFMQGLADLGRDEEPQHLSLIVVTETSTSVSWGVTIDQEVNWISHMTTAAGRAGQRSDMMCRDLPPEMTNSFSMYKALVRNVMGYTPFAATTTLVWQYPCNLCMWAVLILAHA